MSARLKPAPFTRFTTLRNQLGVGQRAFALVAYDELEPGRLKPEERARAAAIFGPIDQIPLAARSVIVQLKGRDVGGTRLGAERCLHLAITANLDRTSPAELVYVVFIGPKLRHARVGLRFARAAAMAHGLTIVEDSSDGFTIVRHDGRRVRFECFAASRGGDTVRGVPIIAAMLDEAAFFMDEATGVVNAEAIFGAIVPRLLPGGQILIVSSPWAETGLLFDEFTRNFGNPTTALAARCPTLVMRDDPETAATVARERARDPENALREFDAEFLPAGSAQFFDNVAIKNAIDDSLPNPLPTDWSPAT